VMKNGKHSPETQLKTGDAWIGNNTSRLSRDREVKTETTSLQKILDYQIFMRKKDKLCWLLICAQLVVNCRHCGRYPARCQSLSLVAAAVDCYHGRNHSLSTLPVATAAGYSHLRAVTATTWQCLHVSLVAVTVSRICPYHQLLSRLVVFWHCRC